MEFDYVYLIASTEYPVMKLGRSIDPVRRFWQHVKERGVCPDYARKSLVLASYSRVLDSLLAESDLLQAANDLGLKHISLQRTNEWFQVEPAKIPSIAAQLGFNLFPSGVALRTDSRIKTTLEHLRTHKGT